MKTALSRRIYTERINRVIDYVAAYLEEPLSLERLARLAHFSPFQFHRIFTIFVGESVHAFTRRLRLEKAVLEMKYATHTTLTDIALRCGFALSSDFSRAFEQAYGFSPRPSDSSKKARFGKTFCRTPGMVLESLPIPRTRTGSGFGRWSDPLSAWPTCALLAPMRTSGCWRVSNDS